VPLGVEPAHCTQEITIERGDGAVSAGHVFSTTQRFIVDRVGAAAEMSDGASLVTLADVEAAATRVKPHIRTTPVLRCEELEAMSGLEFLGWKCENLQRTGAFKARGAVNAVAFLQETTPELAVFVTHSSGNHGQALAYACKTFGKRAKVVVPSDAPAPKVQGLRRLGAEIVFCEPNQRAREATCDKVLATCAQGTGRLLHPYDDPLVIAGQGTVGLEILGQVQLGAATDAVLVPVGGGGMISGIATAVKGRASHVQVIGAEPLNADDATRSFNQGPNGTRPLPHRPGMPNTIGDGLRATLSARTFAHLRARVDDVVSVSEDQIRRAMRLVFEHLKVVIEPSAGVGAAVALLPEFAERRAGWKRVVVVLCGGNVDLDLLSSDYLSPAGSRKPAAASSGASVTSKL
jgi:threonine dehydratase